jgi:hypothetical protein
MDDGANRKWPDYFLFADDSGVDVWKVAASVFPGINHCLQNLSEIQVLCFRT